MTKDNEIVIGDKFHKSGRNYIVTEFSPAGTRIFAECVDPKWDSWFLADDSLKEEILKYDKRRS